jgi:hypothetical protein
MTPSASMNTSWPGEPHRDNGVLWASLIALLFAAVAATSFAVDQSVTLSSLPTLQPEQAAGQ